jgi:hypothetical protein
MPLPQAPQRQTTNVPITPIVGDILVTVTYEAQRKELPPYGTLMSEMHQKGKIDQRYKDHVFTLAVPLNNEREDMFTLYFAAPREGEDEYNWEMTQADIGGTKFDAVARTYIVPRADYDPTSPAMGEAMPDTPAGKFATPSGYILAVKSQRRIEKEFDSHFVAETRVYVRKTTITQIGADPLNGLPLSSSSTIYHKDEIVTGATTAAPLFADPTNAYWGTQSTGYARTGRQLSSEFYEIISEQVVAGAGSGGLITVNDYNTTEDFSWPAVFGGVRVYSYDLRNGGFEVYAEPYFTKEAYRGPCRARILVTWSAAEHIVSEPKVMQPLPISVNTPFYRWAVGPCLHPAGTITAVTGNHPKYALNAGIAAEWDETSPTEWPDSVLAVDEQKPYRGGWLRTEVTIYQPTYAI